MPSDGGDSGAASGRSATAPGMGPPSSGRRAAAEATAPAVDFDALSAALGGAGGAEDTHDSHGRSSASYASTRPHAVPAAHITAEATEPAVIVTVDDTVPSAPPPNMTTPIAVPHTAPLAIVGVPSSGSVPAAVRVPSEPFTPQPFTPTGRGGNQMTMRMAERPRRPRAMTIVVRPRGPSTAQKLVAFMAMLVLVTACGIAVIIWRKPAWLGLVPENAIPPRAVTAAPVGKPPPPVTATAAPAAAALSSLPAVVTPAPAVTSSAVAVPHAPAAPSPKRAPKPVPANTTR